MHGNTYPATLRLRPHDEGEEFLRNIVGTKDQYHALQALDLYAGLCPKPQGYVMKADWIRALNTLVKREEPMWTGGHKLFWRLLEAHYFDIDPASWHTVKTRR